LPVGNIDENVDEADCEKVFIIEKDRGSIKITKSGVNVKKIYHQCLFKNNICVEIKQ